MTRKYIGTKIITAWPQQKDGVDGYAVKYQDGYTSWSPKLVFEESYRAIEREGQALTFGDAVHMLKVGHRVARTGWNGKGMYIYLVAGSEQASEFGADPSWFNPYMVIRNVNGSLSTWVPSVNDCLAEDWQVLV